MKRLLLFLALSPTLINGFWLEPRYRPSEEYCQYLSEDDYKDIIQTIPEEKRYTRRAVISVNINEPFLISLDSNYYLNLDEEKSQYFSTIFKFTDEKFATEFIPYNKISESVSHYIFIPCKSAMNPFFIDFIFPGNRCPRDVEDPPHYCGSQISFAINIKD